MAGASNCTDALNSKGNGVIDAVKNNDTEALKRLLEDPELLELSTTDENGRNALHWAAHLGNAEHVNLLVNSNRVNIHVQDKKGYTALVLASMLRHTKVVGALLRKFVFNEDVVDEFFTAHTIALQYGYFDVAKIMDEAPFGYHVAIKEMINIMNEMKQLKARDRFLKDIDADRSEIKDQIAELENKKSEFLTMAPDYSMDNGTLSFRSKTLFNQTIKVELDTPSEELIATVLSNSQGDIDLEKALEVFKTFPY